MNGLVGYRESQGRAVYPDANSTLRVAFGNVIDLHPRDAVRYAPVTTVAGIVAKHTGVAPFDAPGVLPAAIAKGDFGSTIDHVLGTQTLNFMTNPAPPGRTSVPAVPDSPAPPTALHF